MGDGSDVKGSDVGSNAQFRSIVKAKKRMPLPDQVICAARDPVVCRLPPPLLTSPYSPLLPIFEGRDGARAHRGEDHVHG